jgi:hypothetical protein
VSPMEAHQIAVELEAIASCKRPFGSEAVLAAPELLAHPRYGGPPGAELLVRDITIAINELPETEVRGHGNTVPLRNHAKLIFPTGSGSAWTNRLEGLPGSDASTKRWYAFYILEQLAHLLYVKLDGGGSFAWSKHSMDLRISGSRLQHQCIQRLVRLEPLRSGQTIVAIRHYYDGNPAEPTVVATSAGHTFIGRVPATVEGRWWDNYFHLDEPPERGRGVVLRSQEEFDYLGTDQKDLEVSIIATTPLAEVIELAITIDPSSPAFSAERRVIANPLTVPQLLESAPIEPDPAGTFKYPFSAVTVGVRYQLVVKGFYSYQRTLAS